MKDQTARQFPDGLYDQIVTELLQAQALAGMSRDGHTVAQLSPIESGQRLAELVAIQLRGILDDMVGEGKQKLHRVPFRSYLWSC